jgi:predicted ATPase/DNA-binding CsgD family transcriptional regulator
LAQEELAARAGLSPNVVGDLERGEHRHPYPATVRALAAALDLDAAERASFLAAVPRRGKAEARVELPGLPAPLSSLVGRESAVADVCALLRRDGALSGSRLVTLIGPGGVGKTRLALQVAADLAGEFAHGAAFVSLAAVRDPGLVGPTIARGLGVVEGGGRAPFDRLREALSARHTLLVLDNYEHVLDAAPLVTDLLAACPRLSILATSRAALRLDGERVFPVPPLAVPDPERRLYVEQLVDVPAVRLFVDRARDADPAFALTDVNAGAVAAICHRLDGLPLAIELAAARTAFLTPDAMLPRLARRLPLLTGGRRDAPARHRTMRDAIAWSHDLLVPAEQALFRRLAVFVGGIAPDAAETVAGATGARDLDALAEIAPLVEASLLRQQPGPDGEPRFVMLETVREYALERLEVSGDEEAEAVRAAHAAHFLALAERAAPVLLGGNTVAWLDRLAADHDNLRAAFDHLCRAATAADCLRLAAACGWYWYRRGHTGEGRAWLARALTLAATEATATRGRALRWAAELATVADDLSTATALAGEALAVSDAAGDARGRVFAVHLFGLIAERQGLWDAATARFAEELVYWRELGEPVPIGMNLMMLGRVAYKRGDLARARPLMHEAEALFRQAGDRTWQASSNHYLGLFAATEGRFPDAARCYRASLRGHAEATDATFIPAPLVGLAALAFVGGDAVTGARLLGSVDAQLQRLGIGLAPIDRPVYEGAETGARAALGDSGFAAAHAVGRDFDRDAWFAAADLIVAALEEMAARAPRRHGGEPAGLTPREVEVLVLIADGLSDRDLAAALFVSQGTVRSHLTSIFAKLGVGSRTAAIAAARHLGIL